MRGRWTWPSGAWSAEDPAGVREQVSEWASTAAIEKAHRTPEVLDLWRRFEACSTYVRLDTLAESHDDFATFEALEAQ